jgi:hypothetical protein
MLGYLPRSAGFDRSYLLLFCIVVLPFRYRQSVDDFFLSTLHERPHRTAFFVSL